MGIKYSKNTIVGEILVFLHPSDTQEGFFHFESSRIPERNKNTSFLHRSDTQEGLIHLELSPRPERNEIWAFYTELTPRKAFSISNQVLDLKDMKYI